MGRNYFCSRLKKEKKRFSSSSEIDQVNFGIPRILLRSVWPPHLCMGHNSIIIFLYLTQKLQGYGRGRSMDSLWRLLRVGKYGQHRTIFTIPRCYKLGRIKTVLSWPLPGCDGHACFLASRPIYIPHEAEESFCPNAISCCLRSETL